MSKTLVIGDIHGCYDELQHLLDRAALTTDDTIIHIGDLVDRGPYPQQVVDFFRTTPNAHSIMGNRDDKHIRAYDGELSYDGVRSITRYYQFDSDDVYAEAVAYMRTLPLYIDLPEAILVHGYYEPGVPLAKQDPDVLLGHYPGEQRLKVRGYSDWYDQYEGEKPLIVGHREYPFFQNSNRVWAIDTRCVYGGALSGVLLPSFTRYSIPARRDYWADIRETYNDLV